MLSGVVVLDLSRVLAGPYCTQLLADLGARVIKVEAPGGDETRSWGPPFAGDESGYFLSINRGKQSVVVDLKNEQGSRIVQRLAQRADVLVENFKVGDLERYGLGADTVLASNPSLIYASITSYGSIGPRAREPGYDAALQAITGLVAMTGEEGGGPVKLGVAWIDVLTGLHAAVSILAALHERQRTGLGRHLELSLFEVGLASMVNQAQGALLTGAAPRRLGSAHPSIVPYQAFETSRGARSDDPRAVTSPTARRLATADERRGRLGHAGLRPARGASRRAGGGAGHDRPLPPPDGGRGAVRAKSVAAPGRRRRTGIGNG
jgi:crotonobetainyl-CoA:carnitine CoA-transferase CaiB-like acyl-CoA transferase